MIYKVLVDATKAFDDLRKMGIKYSIKKKMYMFVDADDPDEACYKAVEKISDQIISENLSDEIINFLEDELRYVVSVKELIKVRPYA